MRYLYVAKGTRGSPSRAEKWEARGELDSTSRRPDDRGKKHYLAREIRISVTGISGNKSSCRGAISCKNGHALVLRYRSRHSDCNESPRVPIFQLIAPRGRKIYPRKSVTNPNFPCQIVFFSTHSLRAPRSCRVSSPCSHFSRVTRNLESCHIQITHPPHWRKARRLGYTVPREEFAAFLRTSDRISARARASV